MDHKFGRVTHVDRLDRALRVARSAPNTALTARSHPAFNRPYRVGPSSTSGGPWPGPASTGPSSTSDCSVSGSPGHPAYTLTVDTKTHFPRLVDKIGAAMAQSFDYTDDVRGLRVPTMLVAADADMAPPSHYVEAFNLGPAGRTPILSGMADDNARSARIEDVHDLASAMPYVTVVYGGDENPIYQVGRKSFVFFRTPQPDATDPSTGERLDDVVMFWVPSEADKRALIQDEASPFFTTPHFDGHPSVLVRASRIGEISRVELAELIQDAWLSRASARRGAAWLGERERS